MTILKAARDGKKKIYVPKNKDKQQIFLQNQCQPEHNGKMSLEYWKGGGIKYWKGENVRWNATYGRDYPSKKGQNYFFLNKKAEIIHHQ